MYEVRIPHKVYRRAEEAAKAHQVSLEQYVTEVLQRELNTDPENFDHFFTPDVLAAIDGGAQDAKSGSSRPIEQVLNERTAKRTTWHENQGH